MKKIFTIASAFAALFLLASCQDELTYTKGEPDVEDCMNVYFPEDQENSGELALTPSASKSLTIYAKRAVTTSDASVPVEIESDTPEYFSVEGNLEFKAGSADGSIVLKIAEDTPLDQTFSCSIKITDSKYVPMYKATASYHDLSVIIENYDFIGTGLFTETFEGVSDYPMSLYQKHGENLFRLAEWPYTQLYEYYAEYYEDDSYMDEMKEVSAKYIYFSLDGNNVVFETWPVEYYDAEAGQIIEAFYPTDLATSLSAYTAYSTISADRTTITMYPYFYVSGLGGWGLYGAQFVLDEATIPAVE